jgi:hypothetical protein
LTPNFYDVNSIERTQMNYNSSNKEKRTTKTVEINNIELQKCRDGKRFKVDVITKTRDGGDPIRPTLRELVEQLIVDVSSLKTDMLDVKDTLKRHDVLFKKHG